MDQTLRDRILFLVKPLYQDLDGVSRFTEVDRISAIARRLYDPSDPATRRHFELLLLFQGLGKWLEKARNLSRASLAVPEVSEEELLRVAAAVRRLEAPTTDAERAIYAARLVDQAGLRGLADRFAQARREGLSIRDVAVEDDEPIPEDLPPLAVEWIRRRRDARRQFQERLLSEISLEDL